MTRILVVDDEPQIRHLMDTIFFDAGYDVIQASNGREALEKVRQDQPDLVLIDVDMPEMNGFEVVRLLRENPSTGDIPIIMMTGLDAAQGESAALDLAVDHYITKPAQPGLVEAAVKVALREAGTVNTPVRIGDKPLDQKLGGGIPLASLTLIEGTSSAGKSVLCQHLMSGALRDGHRVACFTSENSVRSLVTQMASIGLEVSRYVQTDKLHVYPIEEAPPDADRGALLAELSEKIGSVPRQYKVIFVDAITNLASVSEDHAIVSFFSSCKRLANGGRIIILVAHSFAFEEKMLIRLRSLCDAHLSLRVETTGAKQSRVMEVSKIHNSEGMTGNVVYFKVEPGFGMRMLPFSRAQA
jgi:flagellar protein FlaH